VPIPVLAIAHIVSAAPPAPAVGSNRVAAAPPRVISVLARRSRRDVVRRADEPEQRDVAAEGEELGDRGEGDPAGVGGQRGGRSRPRTHPSGPPARSTTAAATAASARGSAARRRPAARRARKREVLGTSSRRLGRPHEKYPVLGSACLSGMSLVKALRLAALGGGAHRGTRPDEAPVPPREPCEPGRPDRPNGDGPRSRGSRQRGRTIVARNASGVARSTARRGSPPPARARPRAVARPQAGSSRTVASARGRRRARPPRARRPRPAHAAPGPRRRPPPAARRAPARRAGARSGPSSSLPPGGARGPACCRPSSRAASPRGTPRRRGRRGRTSSTPTTRSRRACSSSPPRTAETAAHHSSTAPVGRRDRDEGLAGRGGSPRRRAPRPKRSSQRPSRSGGSS
jgi:hypothetical protein